MTITALAVVTDAYERCNRLSPGEVLNADDSAFGLRRLNVLADEMSGKGIFLYKSILTSASQTGSITLGSGSWAAISPGDDIVSGTANGLPMSPITMRQYNELYDRTLAGLPSVYAPDGLSTVFLWPVPTAVTISLQTRIGVAQFADLTTTYTVPDGFTAALGAMLAVRIAPNIIGKIPPDLLRAEKAATVAVSKYQPAIVNVRSYTRSENAGTYPEILYGG